MMCGMRSIIEFAQFLAVCRRSKMGAMGTRRPRRGARLCSNWLRVLQLALTFCSLCSNALPQVTLPFLSMMKNRRELLRDVLIQQRGRHNIQNNELRERFRVIESQTMRRGRLGHAPRARMAHIPDAASL